MCDAEQAGEQQREEELDWVFHAEIYAVGYIHILVTAVERGEIDLGVEPAAWENTMTAVEWAMTEHVHGRVQGPTPITTADVDRMRRLHALGSLALSGGDRSPELSPLAFQCMESLVGPAWRRIAREAELHVHELNRCL